MFAKVNFFDSNSQFNYSIYYFPFMWSIFFTSHWEHFHTNKFVLGKIKKKKKIFNCKLNEGYLSSGDGINAIMMELLLLIFNFEFINLKLFSNFISIGEIIILIIFVNCFFTSLRIIISTLKKQKISYLIPLFDLFPLILICSNFIIFCKVNDQLWLNYQSLTGNK